MKKLRLPLLAVLLTGLCFSSCNKKDKKQYSTWYVNNHMFTTNEVTKTIGKAGIADLSSLNHDNQNYFALGFDLSYFPQEGTFPLKHSSVPPNPLTVGIAFHCTGIAYMISPSENSSITASSVNGKARYTLPPTWFVNHDNLSDSVLIHGVFNEP